MSSLSFFINRKVKEIKDNIIWIECVKQIRNFYKDEMIYIIDDDNMNIVDLNDVSDFTNENIQIITINDEKLKGRGEFISFYYYLKLKPSPKAIFIQDSFFIMRKFDERMVKNQDICFLFGFIDKEEFAKSLVNNLIYDLNEGDKILKYKYKYNWVGCFGVSCLISFNYLLYLNERYNLLNLAVEIKSKLMREVFERVFGLLITYDKRSFDNISFYGLKGSYNYDLKLYFSKKDELNIPYFNFHQHQIEE